MFYFPLIPRLKALLDTPQFRKLIEHENERPYQEHLITDIYDTQAWKQFAGQASRPIQRIILQFCLDGIPAFAEGSLSLKPAEFLILNLPPGLRGRAENIMLFMLLPDNMKSGQKKYFDFAARYELDQLYSTGLFNGKKSPSASPTHPPYVLNKKRSPTLYTTGVRGVKVKVFGTSMDTKGREELTGKYAQTHSVRPNPIKHLFV